MPLPRDRARETRAVHTADIHISEPNGTDIWIDVRVGMAKPDCSVPKDLERIEQEKRKEYGQGPSNPNSLFDGVVPVIFEQHGCPNPCAITFLHHVLRRRVARLEQGSHHPWGGMHDRCPRTVCTNLLYPSGHAPSNVPGMLSYCANTRSTERTNSHGLLHCPLSACFSKRTMA